MTAGWSGLGGVLGLRPARAAEWAGLPALASTIAAAAGLYKRLAARRLRPIRT